MSVATFVMDFKGKHPEGEIVYECVECAKEVAATDSDKHAVNKHKASMIRVFHSPGAYQDFLRQEKILTAIKQDD